MTEPEGAWGCPTSLENVMYLSPNCSVACFCRHRTLTLFHFLPAAAQESLSLLVKSLVLVRLLPAFESGTVMSMEEGRRVMKSSGESELPTRTSTNAVPKLPRNEVGISH